MSRVASLAPCSLSIGRRARNSTGRGSHSFSLSKILINALHIVGQERTKCTNTWISRVSGSVEIPNKVIDLLYTWATISLEAVQQKLLATIMRC